MAPTDDPILQRFRAALDVAYGTRVARVVLFGSRARGDAREDSDYDVAVFLEDSGNYFDEKFKITPVEDEIMLETGLVINAMPLEARSYEERTGFMREVRREGLDF